MGKENFINIKFRFLDELRNIISFSSCFGFSKIFIDSAHSECNVSCSHGSTPTVNALGNEKSHDFCLLANISDGRVLIGTEYEVCFCSFSKIHFIMYFS